MAAAGRPLEAAARMSRNVAASATTTGTFSAIRKVGTAAGNERVNRCLGIQQCSAGI